jgi:hypothetical protein
MNFPAKNGENPSLQKTYSSDSPSGVRGNMELELDMNFSAIPLNP